MFLPCSHANLRTPNWWMILFHKSLINAGLFCLVSLASSELYCPFYSDVGGEREYGESTIIQSSFTTSGTAILLTFHSQIVHVIKAKYKEHWER